MLSIIAAVAQNGVIGKDNALIWRLKPDLKRFRSITKGKTVIAGRKTFESLNGSLSDRKHIVLTRDSSYKVDDVNVSVVTGKMEETFLAYKNIPEESFIIGGGQIYKQALPYCDKLYITKILKDFEGDTFFPAINDTEFQLLSASEIMTDEITGLTYIYENYERIGVIS